MIEYSVSYCWGVDVKSAEDQIWDEKRRLEKIRVEKIQKNADKEKRKTDVRYSPEKVEKPWTWGSSARYSLYNIPENLVLSVKDFNFDLNNKNFVNFLEEKGHLHICGKEESNYWNLINNKGVKQKDFMENKNMRLAQLYNEKRHIFSDGEMKTLWKIFQYSRVFLQGAYDHFKKHEVTK